MDARDEFLRGVAAGRSFADVGGLYGTVKEKVSVAAEAGATEVTMIDIAPDDNPLWVKFRERLDQIGVSRYRCISAGIDDPEIESITGTFDVVHCSGVLYHCPNPVLTLSQLRRIAGRHLVLTSTVVPETIEGSGAQLRMEPGKALFIPGLGEAERALLAEHWSNLSVNGIMGVQVPVARWDPSDYAPWWWLYTPLTLRRMVEAAGWAVLDEAPVWGGRSHALLAEPRP